jgi:phosphoribosylformimino-5-aminoimidazole carboxamide ribotide isomerase
VTSTFDAFRLYPAIDLIDGRAVRLLHGQFDHMLTNELDDARVRAAMVWEAGATALHVIDLDAARTGAPAEPNLSLIAELAAAKPAGALLQVGGGLRSADAVRALLGHGVDRVLIGTMALRDPELLGRLVQRHGNAIAVALDSREGTVRISGWTEDVGVQIEDAAQSIVGLGVETLLITGIDRDGTLAGPDQDLLRRVRRAVPAAGVIAAGGVTTPADVRAVRALGCAGAVVGRALLDDPAQITALLQASA